jgi:hypothetical protein
MSSRFKEELAFENEKEQYTHNKTKRFFFVLNFNPNNMIPFCAYNNPIKYYT